MINEKGKIMKKVLFAVFGVFFATNALAVDVGINSSVLTEIAVKEIVNVVTGGKREVTIGGVDVHTGAIMKEVTGQSSAQCWNTTVYRGDGTKTVKLKCQ